jgi:hypothetical protein
MLSDEKILATLFLLLLVAGGISAAQDRVTIYGDGYDSCARAWSPDKEYASFTWVMGWRAAVNDALFRATQRKH